MIWPIAHLPPGVERIRSIRTYFQNIFSRPRKLPDRQPPKLFTIPLRFGIRLQADGRTEGKINEVRTRLLLNHNRIVVPHETQNFSRLQKSSGDDAWSDYLYAKYCGIDDYKNIDKFSQTAEMLSKRIELNPWFKQHLYPQRNNISMLEEDWCQHVRLCSAQEQIICDLHLNGHEELTTLFHPDAGRILQEIYSPQPPIMLLLTHCGPRWPRNIVLRDMLSGYLPLAAKGYQKPYVWGSPNEMVMVAIRALASGRSVVAAPDGPLGEQRAYVTVAGHRYDLGRGLPTIAYEAKAGVKWFHVEFSDGGFLPVVIDGPTVETGEKLSSFRQRFLSFYEKCLDDLLRGNPRRIQLLTTDIPRMIPVQSEMPNE